MVDTRKLKLILSNFASSSVSTSSNSSPATVAELERLKRNVVDVLTAFIRELEREQSI